MLPIRNISYLSPTCCSFQEKCINSHKSDLGCSTPLKQKFWAETSDCSKWTWSNNNINKLVTKSYSGILSIVNMGIWCVYIRPKTFPNVNVLAWNVNVKLKKSEDGWLFFVIGEIDKLQPNEAAQMIGSIDIYKSK